MDFHFLEIHVLSVVCYVVGGFFYPKLKLVLLVL